MADASQNTLYLQRFGLWDYDGKLCQNVGIIIKTKQLYSKLEGSVQFKLKIDQGVETLNDIPIAISMKDH